MTKLLGRKPDGGKVLINITTSNKTYKTVDNAFLTPRTVALSGTPKTDSEFVFLNGLLISDSCYTIVGDDVIFDAGLPFVVGDFLDIRYLI